MKKARTVSSLIIILLFLHFLSSAQERYRNKTGKIKEFNVILPFNTIRSKLKFEVIDRKVILEGDMILGFLSQFEGENANAINGTNYRWSNNTIPYIITQNHPATQDIIWAINHINQKTNLRLVARTNENDYITFVSGSGCASAVGKVGGNQDITIGSCSKGSIAHEILHSAGIYHEQSRNDRDSYIRINSNNITQGDEHNFAKHTSNSTDIGTYDYGSIMHYPANAFSKNSNNTIDILSPPASAGTVIGQRVSLSQSDIVAVNQLYPANPLDQKLMMSQLRQVNAYASLHGFVGAFLNFHRADYGNGVVNGTFLLKSPFTEWRDIPLSELNITDLNDLAERFRASAVWATNHNYAVGLPNFFHTDYGSGIVCGTLLLNSDAVEWRDVPISELNNVALNDLDGRFRETANYATKNGFLGGFPNFFQADYGNGIVCGTFLLKQNVAEWKDICISPFIKIESRTGFVNPNNPNFTPKYLDIKGLGFFPNGKVKVDCNISFGVGENNFISVNGLANKEGEVLINIPITEYDLSHYSIINIRVTDLTNNLALDAFRKK